MRVEVYLLSIPFARHRSIVPRPHRFAPALEGYGVPPVQRQQSVTDALTEPRTFPDAPQPIDHD